MDKIHHYKTSLNWTGNSGKGTLNYKSYERSYAINIIGKPEFLGSSDPNFLGDKSKYNPEDLLLASISSCHMLWFLHFCSVENIIVVDYIDNAEGIMIEEKNGKGYFSEVVLKPTVFVTEENMIEKAMKLHNKANKFCFIANSLNFKVKHQAEIILALKSPEKTDLIRMG